MLIQPTELQTNRLLLRPFQLEDAEDYATLVINEEFAYFASATLPTRNDAEKAFAYVLRSSWRTRPRFAVVCAGRVLGLVDLRIDHSNSLGRLGFGIAREHWGKGWATEAARAVVAYGFRSVDLAKVYARADPRNTASVRVLEKLSMQREGLLRSHVVRRGVRADRVYYGLMREEWLTLTRPPTPCVQGHENDGI